MFKFLGKRWSEKPINRQRNSFKTQEKSIQVEHEKHNLTKLNPINVNNDYLEKINTFEELFELINNFQGCKLRNLNTNTVIYCGSFSAKIMIIGEAPGEEENEQKKPFVGTSGRLLRTMLQNYSFDESNVYITNCVFWKPPMNRKPTEDEINICKPFVLKQIDLLQPKLILLLGAVALNMMFGQECTITKNRGNFMNFKDIQVIATFHPAYILRMPKQKDIVMEDLEKLYKKYNEIL